MTAIPRTPIVSLPFLIATSFALGACFDRTDIPIDASMDDEEPVPDLPDRVVPEPPFGFDVLFYDGEDVRDVAVFGDRTYFIEHGSEDSLGNHHLDGRLLARPLVGGAIEVLAEGLPAPTQLIVSSTHVYMKVEHALLEPHLRGPAIIRIPRSAPSPVELVYPEGDCALTEPAWPLEGDSVVFLCGDHWDPERAVTMSSADSSPRALTIPARPWGYAIDGDFIYLMARFDDYSYFHVRFPLGSQSGEGMTGSVSAFARFALHGDGAVGTKMDRSGTSYAIATDAFDEVPRRIAEAPNGVVAGTQLLFGSRMVVGFDRTTMVSLDLNEEAPLPRPLMPYTSVWTAAADVGAFHVYDGDVYFVPW